MTDEDWGFEVREMREDEEVPEGAEDAGVQVKAEGTTRGKSSKTSVSKAKKSTATGSAAESTMPSKSGPKQPVRQKPTADETMLKMRVFGPVRPPHMVHEETQELHLDHEARGQWSILGHTGGE